MSRPPARSAAADSEPDRAERPEPEPGAGPTPAAVAATGSLSDLPVAGLTRRRIALLIGALVAAWVVVLFARQVGEASEATTRAAEMRASNTELARDVAAAQHELTLIQQQAYIQQQAREYRLGDPVWSKIVEADPVTGGLVLHLVETEDDDTAAAEKAGRTSVGARDRKNTAPGRQHPAADRNRPPGGRGKRKPIRKKRR